MSQIKSNKNDIESRFKVAEQYKQQGNTLFQKGNLQDAIESYQKAVDALPIKKYKSKSTSSSSAGTSNQALLKPTILSNKALCYLKLCEIKDQSFQAKDRAKLAEDDCSNGLKELDSLTLDSESIASLRAKLLYRRAKAFFLQTFNDNTNKTKNDESNAEKNDTNNMEDMAEQNICLNAAAKDLLSLLSFDKKNSSAMTLLRQVRERHGSFKTSPISQALAKLSNLQERIHALPSSSSNNDKNEIKQKYNQERYDGLKMVYGLLCQDIPSSSMEIGKHGAVSILSQIAISHDNTEPISSHNDTVEDEHEKMSHYYKSRALAIQILSVCTSHIPFATSYLRPFQFRQSTLSSIMSDCQIVENYNYMDLAISIISLMLRIVIAFHREEINNTTAISPYQHEPKSKLNSNSGISNIKITFTDHNVDGSALSKICINSFHIISPISPETEKKKDNRLQRAAIDLLSTWTSSDWDEIALSASSLIASESTSTSSNTKQNKYNHQTTKLTEMEIQSLPPREFAAYRKREYESLMHRKKVAKRNVLLFFDEQTGGLHALLNAAIACGNDFRMRREIGLVVGRMLHIIIIDDGSVDQKEEGKLVQKLTGPILGYEGEYNGEEEKMDGLKIEEIYDDDDDDDDLNEEEEEGKNHETQNSPEKLKQEMIRGVLTSSLLLSNAEVGTWALSKGWANGEGNTRLRSLIESKNIVAMSIASELISSAASVEKARPYLSPLIQNGDFDVLLKSENSDIRSGAASAISKLGLASKGVDGEGEVMGLLQVAADLIYEDEDYDEMAYPKPGTNANKLQVTNSLTNGQNASTAYERGIELLSYLASKTLVKEELAHGFRSTKSPGNSTTLDRLVQLTRKENIVGESITSYGIATIFAHMAVSLETLRREAFIGKDVTAEQYDELQALAKTKEEKDSAKEAEELEKDLPQSVNARIRKMANVDVPLAMVKLMDSCGYSNESGHAHETTLEQLVVGMERMTVETSVRGIMVQQGCLSACIKLEKGQSSSEKRKKILRHARHCIAKILVTTNPHLLTSAQRLGSLGPMMQLVNDGDSSDLAKFEALLSITNIASTGMEAKHRIVSEKGISILNYAMFSDHDMVRRAATEAMSNLVPHENMMEYLSNGEKLRLWVSFATDYEDHLDCAKAAAGCLAMACNDLQVAKTLVKLKNFNSMIRSLLECGNLDLMHRVLVIIQCLLGLKDSICFEEVQKTGAITFCEAYAASYGGGISNKREELGLNVQDEAIMKVTVDLAMGIVKSFG